MAYLYINLFDHRDQGRLDPDEAVVRLQEQFPEAIVLPGDQLSLSARRAEHNLDPANPANRAVAQKLCWDAQHLGPAYAFYIPAGPAARINGVVKRYQADFHCDAPIAEDMRARLIGFLRSLIPASMAIDVREEWDEPAETVEHR
jgi:hypothetical protein